MPGFLGNLKRLGVCLAGGNEDSKRKLPRDERGRNGKFRNDDPMTVVGVPDVRVVEAVHVRLELAPIDVDVRDEDGILYDISSVTPAESSYCRQVQRVESPVGHRSPPIYLTNWLFLF